MQDADEVQTGTEAAMDDEGDADNREQALHANSEHPGAPESQGSSNDGSSH